MDSRQAEDHLRVIRTLMERATLYRTLSGPVALVAGALSLAAAGLLFLATDADPAGIPLRGRFVFVWGAVLALTLCFNAWIVHRDAQRRESPFVSAPMIRALWGALPALVAGAGGTLVLLVHGVSLQLLVAFWMFCYGLVLLSSLTYAPRSLRILGWAFLGAGLLFGLLSAALPMTQASLSLAGMAVTFGGFHLLYAMGVMLAGKPR